MSQLPERLCRFRSALWEVAFSCAEYDPVPAGMPIRGTLKRLEFSVDEDRKLPPKKKKRVDMLARRVIHYDCDGGD